MSRPKLTVLARKQVRNAMIVVEVALISIESKRQEEAFETEGS